MFAGAFAVKYDRRAEEHCGQSKQNMYKPERVIL
jgi:hypothetical protein